MKATLTMITLLAGAVAVHSQNAVPLSDYQGIQVLNVQASAPAFGTAYTVTYGGYTSGTEYYGNGSNPNLGQTGPTEWAAGSALGLGYAVHLLAAPGAGVALDSLMPVSLGIISWDTPAGGNPNLGANGFWDVPDNISASVPGANSAITVAFAAWNDDGNTVLSLAAAQADGLAWGISQSATISVTPGQPVLASSLFASIDSFSLGANTVPEPDTIALGVLGASAFLFRRRG
jgi:hypothetical protein